MNRRSFFSGLAAPIAAVTLMTPDQAPAKPARLVYKGYALHFTGWKNTVNQDGWAAQWLAWPVAPYIQGLGARGAPVYICAGCPGPITYYRMGECFDISLQKGQKFIMENTSQADKDAAKEETLNRLKRFIDENPDPLTPLKRDLLRYV